MSYEDQGWGKYDDPEFGEVFIPRPKLRHRARAFWYFFRLQASAALARKWPKVSNRKGELF